MVRIILTVIVLSVFFGCNKKNNPNKYACLKKDMTYWGHYVNSSQLKLNGFYFGKKDTSKLSPHGTLVILLYNTGIIYFSGVKSDDKIEIKNEPGKEHICTFFEKREIDQGCSITITVLRQQLLRELEETNLFEFFT